MDLENMPVVNGLLKYMNQGVIPFHMPGHKGNINEFEELNFIKDRLFEFDKTEVPGLDNLHAAEAMILEGQKLAARAFKAGNSYFLVNGSTCGIYSMIMGITKPGDKVIIQRNCHRSVYMASLLGELAVKYIDPEIVPGFDIPGGIELAKLIEIMEENKDAKALVLTYPSYYGICSDLENIISEAHARGILVLVDEAHGAHLPFNSKLPRSAMELGADVSVISLHKSLPALTQASLLNINNGIDPSGIRFMLKLFQTTSPSYILMASIDAARCIMETRGASLLEATIESINEFKTKLSNLNSYKILEESHIGKGQIKELDITKLVIYASMGGTELENKLRENYNIQVEMSDINNIVIIATVGDNKDYFEKLYKALYNIDKDYKASDKKSMTFKAIKYKTILSMRAAYYGEKCSLEVSNAEGQVSGEMLVPYPPGIPILLPGELISKEIIDYIHFLKTKGIQINGMNDVNCETILIVKSGG